MEYFPSIYCKVPACAHSIRSDSLDDQIPKNHIAPHSLGFGKPGKLSDTLVWIQKSRQKIVKINKDKQRCCYTINDNVSSYSTEENHPGARTTKEHIWIWSYPHFVVKGDKSYFQQNLNIEIYWSPTKPPNILIVGDR